jgi:DNA-binding beta-propeller fold protein YncE
MACPSGTGTHARPRCNAPASKRVPPVAFLVWVAATATLAQSPAPLLLDRTIPLDRVEGRIDHMAIDVSGGRLFVAALGNGSVEVVDLKRGTTKKAIANAKEPQGLAYVADINRLFVATGSGGILRILDGTSFQVMHSITLGDDADNVRWDSVGQRLYVGYGSGAITSLRPDGTDRLNTPLRGHPESFQVERNGSRIFVNVPTAKEVAVIDRAKNAVVAKWGTGFAFANFPMALDESSKHLFIVCRTPARLLVLDIDSGATVAKLETAGDADDVYYDSARHRVYVSGGDGSVRVIARRKDGVYEQTARIQTAAGARTSLFVPELNELFVAVPHRSAQHAAIQVYRVQ